LVKDLPETHSNAKLGRRIGGGGFLSRMIVAGAAYRKTGAVDKEERRMRLNLSRLTTAGLAFSAALLATACFAAQLRAQEAPARAAMPSIMASAPLRLAQADKSEAPPAKPETTEPEAPAGIPIDAAAEPQDIESRPTAFVQGQAKWNEGFATLMSAQAKIKEAIDKAGLKQAGPPITVFTETNDNGFSFDAMLPLADKPADNLQLGNDVKLGQSPSGKAIKFLHRGAYEDIDSTYDLITAYLDEKGLEARNFFVEEYESELKSPDDQNLAVDIYVFIK
jgi:effector-binding domain-containing protein